LEKKSDVKVKLEKNSFLFRKIEVEEAKTL